VWLISSRFCIRKHNVTTALKSINGFFNDGGKTAFEHLGSAFFEYGWHLLFNSDGDVVGIDRDGDKTDDGEDFPLSQVAAQVEPGCYIHTRNEYEVHWGRFFDGKNMHLESPTIQWQEHRMTREPDFPDGFSNGS
jgi:hypothetical protein